MFIPEYPKILHVDRMMSLLEMGEQQKSTWGINSC